MASCESAIDFTVNLPDELLQEVFGYLPLRDKLRLESVSHRFQRCILYMLERNPLPLELNIYDDTLNGYKIRVGSVTDALRSFASKVKFNSIVIRHGSFDAHLAGAKINSILPILIESENCLEKVISFKTDCDCSQDNLEMLTSKCPKLSIVGLDYVMRSPKHLGTALNNKALTELELAFSHSDTEELLLMFQSLKPNTLRELHIRFCGRTQDRAKMADELRTSAWAALQELKMNISYGNMQVAPFFDSLAHLPSLNRCHIDINDQRNNQQFLAAMKSLFKSSINISVRSFGCFFRALPGCQIISQIQQIQAWAAQNLKAGLIVDFEPTRIYGVNLKLSLNNVLFEESVYSRLCANAHCVDCRRFYPNVLWRLAIEAHHPMADYHLDEFQLDKCRIGDVVDHLEKYGSQIFLPTGASETQDLVTISFKTRHQPIQEFNITAASRRCFSNSCVKCIDI